MKIRSNSRLFYLLIIALVTMGAMQAQAIIVICRPIGIVAGQTARVTAANTGARAIIVDWRIWTVMEQFYPGLSARL
jgi:hypothetical protein